MKRRKGVMHARMIALFPAALQLLATIAQHTARDTSDAYHRKFSVGVGLAIPYPSTEQLYTSSLAGDGPFDPYRLEDLWRNVFTRETVEGIQYKVYPPRIGYCPSDRIELSLGFWNHRGVWDEDPPRRYVMRMTRVFAHALYRPPVGMSSRLRPIVGVSLAWDERNHEMMSDPYYSDRLFTCRTRSGMASVVVGLRMQAGHFLFGLDLNAVALAYIKVQYADDSKAGTLDHWMDPATAFKERYAYGPITLHANYTFCH
ncbi:MAG: hypothetical protein KA230_13890 [Flavobacteriales bacterium]|nr:hypothetical protein [Flavobacteriales bacterium]